MGTVPRQEAVAVADGNVFIVIYTSSAAEYYGVGDRAVYEYAHLDLDFSKLPPRSKMASFNGILPQLWGIREVSPEVKEMMEAGALAHPEEHEGNEATVV